MSTKQLSYDMSTSIGIDIAGSGSSEKENARPTNFSAEVCEQWDYNLQHCICFGCRLHSA